MLLEVRDYRQAVWIRVLTGRMKTRRDDTRTILFPTAPTGRRVTHVLNAIITVNYWLSASYRLPNARHVRESSAANCPGSHLADAAEYVGSAASLRRAAGHSHLLHNKGDDFVQFLSYGHERKARHAADDFLWARRLADSSRPLVTR